MPSTTTSGKKGRVALVTCKELSEDSPDERLLSPLLEARGFEVARLPWDQDEHAWDSLDGLVVRSTWDYSTRVEEFLGWIQRVEGMGVPLWNPAPLLRWNHDKRYLEDLEERGIPVVPTGWIEQGGLVHLHHIMELEGWDEAVVKPMISAGGANTFSVRLSEAPGKDLEFRAMVRERGMMVQELMPEIRKDGEVSLAFFDGEFSHAVRKRPAAGEFRTQERLGAVIEPEKPSERLLEQARRVLEAVEGEWLYARVDGVVRKGELVLMELELLEPSMFCEYAEGSAERFADAIVRKLT